jgi:RimJ/RimL family protein N-acetyltransferase
MEFRTVTIQDVPLLLEWRNDAATRRASRRTWVFTSSEMEAEVIKAIDDPHVALFIAEVGSQPVGTIRADYGPTTELSWTVAPAFRGRGYATLMLRKMIEREGTRVLLAEIKRTNTASIRLAQANGFRPVLEKGELLVLERPPGPPT